MAKEEPTQPIKELQTDKSEQNLTKEAEEFKPTKKMLRWFDTTVELGYTASILDISNASKVSRTQWYEWSRNDEFVKWWDDQMQRNLHQNRWKLDKIGLKQAKNKYNYWKDMMNRSGNTIPEAQQIGQQVNQQFNLPNANLERITK